jgi:hypothetical protein
MSAGRQYGTQNTDLKLLTQAVCSIGTSTAGNHFCRNLLYDTKVCGHTIKHCACCMTNTNIKLSHTVSDSDARHNMHKDGCACRLAGRQAGSLPVETATLAIA